MAAVYNAYVALGRAGKVAVSRDILEIWGQFGFLDVERDDVAKKLNDFVLDPSPKESGYPSIDFVKETADPSSKIALISDWTDLFTRILKEKTFVLKDTSASIKRGLFLDSQTGKILDEESHQNALIMLRAVVAQSGEANMLKEIERLFHLIGESEWESFETVVKTFNGLIETKISNLDKEIEEFRVEEPLAKELDALKKELEQVQEKLSDAKEQAKEWDTELADQRDSLGVLEERNEEMQGVIEKIEKYVDSTKFKGDSKLTIRKSVLDLIQ